ncbi:hypothetical protein LJK87_45565 [Paenibacillus sp. P25]|nr:hypothetical protein LJK87_45565 [Paenibacillus sp. P25]
MAYKIEKREAFDEFNHLTAGDGVYLRGFFLKESIYKEIERVVMQYLGK